ncbi:hypothetical protein [Streptomyces sp. NPDC020996]|uniref:hypothetical protein n=1 Tax=Streptomyces sp. NPDC020996 TaxID=3154791 RepID=UPI0033E2C81B
MIVVLGAGVFGVGRLIDYQRDRKQAAERAAAAEKPPHPSPRATTPGGGANSGAPLRCPAPAGGGGPVRYEPPSYTPHMGATSPVASPSAVSGGKGASASPSGRRPRQKQESHHDEPAGRTPPGHAAVPPAGPGDAAQSGLGLAAIREATQSAQEPAQQKALPAIAHPFGASITENLRGVTDGG